MEPDLDINELHKIHDVRAKNKRGAFESVYLRCRAKILQMNSIYYRTECTFTIPNLSSGLPLYNVESCTAYIIYKLRKQKFQVQYLGHNKLWISWSKRNVSSMDDNSEQSSYYDRLYYDTFQSRDPNIRAKAEHRVEDIIPRKEYLLPSDVNKRHIAPVGRSLQSSYHNKELSYHEKQIKAEVKETVDGKEIALEVPTINTKSESGLAKLHEMVKKL